MARKWLNRSVGISINQSKFAKAARFEELNNGRIFNNEFRPCNAWGGNGAREHLAQLQLLSNKRVILDDALVDPIPVAFDVNDKPIYRIIYHDSKLTDAAPWTENQFSEIIDVFRNINKEFVEFEVRNGPKYFSDLYPDTFLELGSKVRIYKDDVYKSISNGLGEEIVKTEKIFD